MGHFQEACGEDCPVAVAGNHGPLKVKVHYAYKVRNIGRVRPILRYCVV